MQIKEKKRDNGEIGDAILDRDGAVCGVLVCLVVYKVRISPCHDQAVGTERGK